MTLEDLAFYKALKKRQDKGCGPASKALNSSIHYVYQYVSQCQPWVYVKQYDEVSKKVVITITDMTFSDAHCYSTLWFCSKPIIQNGTLEKNSVRTFLNNLPICGHSNDMLSVMAIFELETLINNVYEYLRCVILEEYLRCDTLDYNNYGILLGFVGLCLKYYSVIVSPYSDCSFVIIVVY
jgi:hypothetical protein